MVNQYNDKLRQQILRMNEMIAKINKYTFDMTYDQFCDNEMCSDACITVLIQIGEIANMIKKQEYKEYDIQLPLREMTEMRNFLVHVYHHVDKQIVRKTIKQSIPSLEKKLTTIHEKYS